MYGFADENLRPPGTDRQPAALADPAPPPPRLRRKELSRRIIQRKLSGQLSGDRACASRIMARRRRPDLAGRARRRARRRTRSTCRPKARRRSAITRAPYPAPPAYPPRDRYRSAPSRRTRRHRYAPPGRRSAARPGPAQGNPVSSFGPVALKPTATLACPIVSVLDRWLADSVQPAAQRWFGARVVEIKQISAYSCRGMNGNPNAHISEHAFGNALDIAAFTLADGRRITVKDGWHGMPEEQGFLRDVQGAACQQFNTVLAPGSNAYHYDHIHVDLMRRASPPHHLRARRGLGRGDRRARRAAQPLCRRAIRMSTGSLGGKKSVSRWFGGRARSTRKTSSRITS